MDGESNPGIAVSTERAFAASASAVFAAFERPDLLAEWWGPDGFTNTFERFEFTPGGRWVFMMHGPNGANFANECVFREIQPHSRVVVEHVVKPWYLLSVSIETRSGQTWLTWRQEFESAEFAARMRPLTESANEQVLDRLQSVLASSAGGVRAAART